MIDPSSIPICEVQWTGARRIIRSAYPTIDLFDDIADPEDWSKLTAAEQKTNPRLVETLGNLDLVPLERRVSSNYLMAPFTHVSLDRPSRFSRGLFGVLYLAKHFETALFETMHHHGRFMALTREAPGWTSQFRELVLDISAALHDLRGGDARFSAALDPNSYAKSQQLGKALKIAHSEGLVYPSQRHPGGQCAGLFYPNHATSPIQGRHLDYHWDGEKVDLYRVSGTTEVWRVTA